MSKNKIKPIDVEKFRVKRNKVTTYQFKNELKLEKMFMRLSLVAMSVFEWHGLPSSIDDVFLERELLRQGSLVFFKDDNMQLPTSDEKGTYLILPYMKSYKVDIYGDPALRVAYGEDYMRYRKNLTEYDSIILYDNILKTSFNDIIYDFAVHLRDIKNAIDNNIRQIKTPFIIATKEEHRESVEQLFKDIEDDKPYFLIKEKFADSIKDIFDFKNVSVELVANELQDYYDAVWNEFMVFAGVGTNASPKRERLVASEVESVNEQSEAFANARLRTRERFCELVNERYDLNISVSFSGKGDDDGTIHDNIIIGDEESSTDKE